MSTTLRRVRGTLPSFRRPKELARTSEWTSRPTSVTSHTNVSFSFSLRSCQFYGLVTLPFRLARYLSSCLLVPHHALNIPLNRSSLKWLHICQFDTTIHRSSTQTEVQNHNQGGKSTVSSQGGRPKYDGKFSQVSFFASNNSFWAVCEH